MPSPSHQLNHAYDSVGNTTLASYENTLTESTGEAGIARNSAVPVMQVIKPSMKDFSFQATAEYSVKDVEANISEASFSTRLVHGEDERKAILETRYPYNIICLLSIQSKFQRKPLRGTGFFISKRCVLTAGHCVYYDGGWMKSITVIPGRKR